VKGNKVSELQIFLGEEQQVVSIADFPVWIFPWECAQVVWNVFFYVD